MSKVHNKIVSKNNVKKITSENNVKMKCQNIMSTYKVKKERQKILSKNNFKKKSSKKTSKKTSKNNNKKSKNIFFKSSIIKIHIKKA